MEVEEDLRVEARFQAKFPPVDRGGSSASN